MCLTHRPDLGLSQLPTAKPAKVKKHSKQKTKWKAEAPVQKSMSDGVESESIAMTISKEHSQLQEEEEKTSK